MEVLASERERNWWMRNESLEERHEGRGEPWSEMEQHDESANTEKERNNRNHRVSNLAEKQRQMASAVWAKHDYDVHSIVIGDEH